MKLSPEQEAISLAALDLAQGQTMRSACPFCHATHEASLAVTRQAEGLVYTCPRAKCGQRGFIPSQGYDPHWEKQQPKADKPVKSFDYDLYELPPSLRRMFHDKYDITEDELSQNGFKYAPDANRVAMPIFNWIGYSVGTVARSYAENCKGAKAISYFNDGQAHLHYVPYAGQRSSAVVCVEDIPSAIRCARFSRACAILGSHLSDDMVAELAGHTQHIILALDPDATAKAFKLRDRYRMYFRNFDVRVLSKDPKDMDDDQLLQEVYDA